MKEMGPFSEIFANLESMNRAVSNALVESAKVSDINHLVISRPGGGGVWIVIGYWGCAAGWGRIFTARLTIMRSSF